MSEATRPLRVGIIGCGVIAETHIGYIRAAGGDVVGVADLSTVRANDFADRFGVQRTYTRIENLLEVELPELVHVLTPPHTHADAAVPALAAGIHAFVEKPLATSVRDVERMALAAEEGRSLLVVDHNRLFDPPMIEARRLLTTGALGDLVGVESFQAGEASRRGWLARLPGGGLGDLLPHPLYLELAFTGAVRELDAMASDGASGSGAEELRVLLRGERCPGLLTISMNAAPGMNTLTLYGTKMSVQVDLNNMTIIKRRETKLPKLLAKPIPNLDAAGQLLFQTMKNTMDFVTGRVRYYPGMGELIRRFYASVRGSDPVPVSVGDAAEVVRVTEQIWDRVGRPAAASAVRAVG